MMHASNDKKVRNIHASIRAKLMNIAKETKRDFNAVLQQYFQERFLYRLSVSEYQSNLILKGALLLLVYQAPRLRPTKDIDFLGKNISNTTQNIQAIIKAITLLSFNDGVTFDAQKIDAQRITENAEYEGVRVKIPVMLGNAKSTLQLDIGFGDEIIDGPREVPFPVLVGGDIPKIKIYSLESSVAEKFQALVKLNVISIRMKDVYDILFHAGHSPFKFDVLRKALETTFHNRGTPFEDCKIVFGEEFMSDPEKQTQWNAFLSRNKLASYDNFRQAMMKLKTFLEPICLSPDKFTKELWDGKLWLWV